MDNRPDLYDEILELTAVRFGVSKDDIISDSRNHTVAAARRVAMYLAFLTTDDACASIAERFRRVPATFSKNARVVRETRVRDASLDAWLAEVGQQLNKKYPRALRPERPIKRLGR
jgi:chromosomal replication initiation ATPase DnaA